ncbi:MAG: sensor domain-containing diguanylate cyclase [Gammaproteobacteria bacterium]|nr:sensor domain-containing diguanylate cyclase [Gammaproteobacteria bacterium]
MIKPPLPHDETLRLKSLHSLKVLDTEPEERFDRITRLARRIFDVPIALVSLVDGDRQWFKSRIGLDATQTPRDISFCGHAIVGSDIFVVGNTKDDERFCDNPLVTDDPNIRFYAGYPLRAPNGLRLGTLCIIDYEPREFSTADAENLQSLGELVEAELFSVTLATTDELTGLSNRRGFMAVAPHALALCQRANLPATLALIDLDGFKEINDNLGHEDGDAALKEFSRCLIKSCRESDIVARVGGDEFYGLFSGSKIDQLQAAFDRLTDSLAESNTARDPRFPIRFSAGAAVYEPPAQPDLDALMRAADEVMYERKRSRAAAKAG